MELVINNVILHDFIIGVEEYVAGRTWNCVLQVVHCKHKTTKAGKTFHEQKKNLLSPVAAIITGMDIDSHL